MNHSYEQPDRMSNLRQKLIVGDSSELMVNSLCSLCSDLGFNVEHRADSVAALLDLLTARHWDMVIATADTVHMNLLPELPRLQGIANGRAVLLLFEFARPSDVRIAFRAGVQGCVPRWAHAEEIKRAINTCASGHRFIAGEFQDHVVQGLSGNGHRYETLSDQERRVFQMLAAGLRVTDAARAMHLSAKTVSTYRTRLIAKLGVASNAALVRYALDEHLV